MEVAAVEVVKMVLDQQKLEVLKIQPVGSGLIDMICPPIHVDDFIDLCNVQGVSILVMIASGMGDGFYCAYYGYDETNDLCQIIVPMVDPSIFE